MLSNSTACLYDDDAPWAVRVMEVKSEVLAAVDRVDTKVDEVKTDITELKTDVAELKTDIAGIKMEIKLLKDYFENRINNIRAGVNNSMAIRLNSLWKWLKDPI